MNPADARSEAINPEVRYEPTDAPAGLILASMAALLVAVAATLFLVWTAQFVLFRHDNRSLEIPLRSVASPSVPPAPRLQGSPRSRMPPELELRQLRDEAQSRLNSYGWVDERSGIARIPIDDAMRLFVDRSGPLSAEEAIPGRTEGSQAATPATQSQERNQ